ncbi:class I SAM-dependent methyltransferase [Devosia sp. 2618]|uniref:class I SAM-dependent methyltransferase n=1 Tax=Devosia sp. 2618 TaxID=3156454 RepID=UPI003395C9C8
MSSFFGEQAAANYLDGPPRKVPGYTSLLRMTAMLLAERAPSDARVLVLGAGGGLELKAFADMQPGWKFDGVDPSGPMLRLAESTVGAHANRVHLHEGYIDAAPDGPFDAASCILTLHFVPRDQRLETLTQIRRRLKPGAPFVAAHISFPQTEPERSLATARHIAFGSPDNTPPEQLAIAAQSIGTKLPVLAPEEEERLLAEAGFTGVSQFYAAFSFRGWVGYAQ